MTNTHLYKNTSKNDKDALILAFLVLGSTEERFERCIAALHDNSEALLWLASMDLSGPAAKVGADFFMLLSDVPLHKVTLFFPWWKAIINELYEYIPLTYMYPRYYLTFLKTLPERVEAFV